MSNYTGCKCPACQQAFTDEDDIVVCPDCGTPYHRSCWEKNAVCLFANRHGTGYEWEPDNKPKAAENEVLCPACHAANPAGAKFCNNCGSPLPRTEESKAPQQNAASDAAAGSGPAYTRTDAGTPPFTGNGPEAFQRGPYIYERKLGPEDDIDGIKAKEWAAYVGKSAPYYLLNFQRMAESGRRFFVNFSAMLFGPLYFFYRKMWKWGALFTALFLVSFVPSVALILVESGSPYTAWINVDVLNTVLNVTAIMDWILIIVRGLFALNLYRSEAKNKIKQLRVEFPNESDRMAVLAAEGGTSVKAVVLCLLLYVIALMIIVRLAGPNLYAMAAALYS